MIKAVSAFVQYLQTEEKSAATIEKYVRDVQGFLVFLAGQNLCKAAVIAYKEHLTAQYCPV